MSDTAPEGVAELDAEALAKVFNGGLEELGFVTRARAGDKTLMDALMPATEALLAAQNQGVAAMFERRLRRRAGAEATCAMRARFGRAKNLGDRSIGRATPARRRWPAFLRPSQRR
jgi:dihydroxyacetone kinase-like protein